MTWAILAVTRILLNSFKERFKEKNAVREPKPASEESFP